MPIKRNCYIKSAHDHAVAQAESKLANISKTRTSYDSVDDVLASVSARSAALDASRESRYTLADGVASFRTLWARGHHEHFPKSVPDVILPTRHVPRIKRQIVEPLRSADVTVSDFLSFLFEQWSMCRHNRAFHKFRYYPDTPALEWLLKYSSIYLRIHQHFRSGFTVEDTTEVSAAPTPSSSDDKTKLRRVVRDAQAALAAKEREIAKLRAENARLQSKAPRRITRSTAHTGRSIPDWE